MAHDTITFPEIKARYFDGRSSHEQWVTLRFVKEGDIVIQGLEGGPLRFRNGEMEIATRLGNTPRSIDLPGGAQCMCDDNDAIDQALEFQGIRHQQHWIHTLESNWPLALGSLVVIVGAVWWSIAIGIPLLAEQASRAIPASISRTLDKQTLALLERSARLKPSKLPEEHQDEVRQQFRYMAKPDTSKVKYRLLIRDSKLLGANAIALPYGTILVTDQFLRLVKHDEELLAVLAHEMGHVHMRHGVRSVLQASLALLVVATVAGDVVSMSGLTSALPALLLESKYSRIFELQADDFAMTFMRQYHIPFHRFTDMLQRLEEDGERMRRERYSKRSIDTKGTQRKTPSAQTGTAPAKGDEQASKDKTEKMLSGMFDFISSHPASEDRIERMLRMEKETAR